MADFPSPDVTDTSRPFWNALNEGFLVFQECEQQHRWLPARDFCPTCLSDQFKYVKAGGRAQLVSWVVYNSAMNDAFKDQVPYNVALVQLEEGPKMMTNILAPNGELKAGMDLQLEIVKQDHFKLAKFKPSSK